MHPVLGQNTLCTTGLHIKLCTVSQPVITTTEHSNKLIVVTICERAEVFRQQLIPHID